MRLRSPSTLPWHLPRRCDATVVRTGFLVVLLVVGLLVPAVPAAADEPVPIRQEVLDRAGEAPDVLIRGSGWGHGVGMSQFGAFAQAKAGWSADDILGYYYPGTEVVTDEDSSRRIRVGIQQAAFTTTLAVDAEAAGPVAVRACGPEGGAPVTTRLPHDDCVDLTTLDPGERMRVCPRTDRLDLVPATDRVTEDCAGEPAHSTTRPVVRIRHDGTRIHTPPPFRGEPTRRFSDGWRDLHRTLTLLPGGDEEPRVHAVQDVPSVETYLHGLDEVPSSWGLEGAASLRAQAITARTFALGRPSDRSDCACNIRSTASDQVYHGDEKRLAAHGDLWVQAVSDSEHRILTYQGERALTYYSSSHGGRSESVEDSWAYGTQEVPYLRSIDDPWSVDPSVNNPYASWTARVSNAELAALVSAGEAPGFDRVERMVVRSRTDGGTPREIEVTGRTTDGEQLTRTFAGRPQDSKPIAGASLRRFLPVLEGGSNGRVRSSQIQGLGFGPFTDDGGSVHEFAISWAAAAGIVQGVDGTRFVPAEPVTRAQMATFLNNTFDLPAVTTTGTFPDVPADSTHAAAIEAIAAAELTTGYEDGTYGPGDPVSREQMASFLGRALAAASDTTGTFTDVGDGSVHRPAIEALVERGITRGCDEGRYCPADPVTRGQLASFVHRVVES